MLRLGYMIANGVYSSTNEITCLDTKEEMFSSTCEKIYINDVIMRLEFMTIS